MCVVVVTPLLAPAVAFRGFLLVVLPPLLSSVVLPTDFPAFAVVVTARLFAVVLDGLLAVAFPVVLIRVVLVDPGFAQVITQTVVVSTFVVAAGFVVVPVVSVPAIGAVVPVVVVLAAGAAVVFSFFAVPFPVPALPATGAAVVAPIVVVVVASFVVVLVAAGTTGAEDWFVLLDELVEFVLLESRRPAMVFAAVPLVLGAVAAPAAAAALPFAAGAVGAPAAAAALPFAAGAVVAPVAAAAVVVAAAAAVVPVAATALDGVVSFAVVGLAPGATGAGVVPDCIGCTRLHVVMHAAVGEVVLRRVVLAAGGRAVVLFTGFFGFVVLAPAFAVLLAPGFFVVVLDWRCAVVFAGTLAVVFADILAVVFIVILAVVFTGRAVV